MAQPISSHRDTFVSAAAASSYPSSASTSYAPYDVFINHRGPDVKNTFAGHLHHRLKSRGLRAFLDRPELRTGYKFPCQIKSAIEVASVHIAIFSEDYAKSEWCLEELVLMLNSKGTVLPVFYNVKPSELRLTKKRKYAEALRKHEEDKQYDWKAIQGWKKALSDVADISGFELEACNGDEVELVDKVVERVLKVVQKPPLYVAKYKIGLQEKLEEFERKIPSQLEEEGRLEAKVVGIVGLGGIGKSTLAREFFNRNRSNYSDSSFLADVRENEAKKSITSLQSMLIKDLRGRDISIHSREEGIGQLEENLKYCHALIILDDVDNLHQLDALILPIKHVLDPMSLILVTSRDKHVLKSARIAGSSIYQLKGLNRPHSLELFCRAFFQPHPPPQFVDLVDGFVKACDGLPLSLQVFGALLCQENDRSYWKEQLIGLQTLPLDIQARLKISYNSLSREEQQIFLDIACFSIGDDKNKWIRIWGGSGWKGSVGLRNLENKCLVDVDSDNEIRMHDHLRDLGREIATEGSMPRRLWSATINDVYDLLEQSSSVTEVRGIKITHKSTFSDKESFRDEVFTRISKLQLLEAEGNLVESILSKARSPNLIWLRWKNCRCSSLPSCIPMRHLRVLEVEGGRLERLWQRGSQPPLQLRELNIHRAPFLEFPNSLRQLEHLEKIALSYSLWMEGQLSALPEEFCHLQSLQYLKLKRCSKLQTLPHSFGKLRNLQWLNLLRCTNLEILPNSIENLTDLHEINLKYCESLELLPNAFPTSTNLREINLRGCGKLKMLPSSIENLTNLQKINLEQCQSLEVLPNSFGTLTNLREINLAGCKNLKLPLNFLENLINIQEINLGSCKSLEVLPNSIGNLTNLQNINLKACENLKVLPDAFRALTNLREINLEGCKKLKMPPNFLENLINIQKINLAGCEGLEVLTNSIGNLTKLQNINLQYCETLEVLPNAFSTLTNLREINLEGCKKLKTPLNFLENLRNIQEINLVGCESLEALPNSIENLTNLQKISLGCYKSLRVHPRTLTNLQEINLAGYKKLKMLPNFLESLINIQDINLEGCASLEVLPISIQNLTSLQNINLKHCESLKVLPDAFGTLTNLQMIKLQGCKSLEVLPNSIENLINLRAINLEGCECLEVLPSNFGNLTNLEYINASHSINLKTPSDAFGNLLQLKHLHLSCCSSLTISNETLGNITRLECLDLSGCLQMEALPLQVLHQRFLKRLNLMNTKIKELPSVPTVCLSNLEELILGSPLLKVFPPWLGLLTSLKNLLLHGCRKLKCLPDSVGQLSQMRELQISDCGIQYLPPAVMKLKNLQILRVRGCPLLKCLPDSVGQLRELEISECGIQYLPPAVIQLNDLHILRVCGCPLLKCLPDSVGQLRELEISECYHQLSYS